MAETRGRPQKTDNTQKNAINLALGNQAVWGIRPSDEYRNQMNTIVPNITAQALDRLVDDCLYASCLLKSRNADRKLIKKHLKKIRNVLSGIVEINFNAKDWQLKKILSVGFLTNLNVPFDSVRYGAFFSDETHDFATDVIAVIDKILPDVSPVGRQVIPVRLVAARRFAQAWANYVAVRPSLTASDNGEIVGPFADMIRLSIRQLPEVDAGQLEHENFIREATIEAQKFFC